MPNHYDILGVDRRATGKDIRKAYKALCERFHPDVNPGVEGINEKFQAIQQAYEILSNTEKRRRYDKTLDVPQGAAIVMLPPPSQTPVREEHRLSVCQAVSLEETLAHAKLTLADLLQLAIENKHLAKEILKRKRLQGDYLAQLGSANEELALEILSQAEYWQLLRYAFAIFNLAKAHASACQLILNNAVLSQQLSGMHLHELVIKHGSPCLAMIEAQQVLRIKYQAYRTLIAWRQGQTATVEQLCQAIQVSAIDDIDLQNIARLNVNLAMAVVKSKRLKRMDLAYLGSAYEAVAIEILSQAEYWQLLEIYPAILHLAKAHVSACCLVLSNPELANQLSGEHLAQLIQKYPKVATAAMVQDRILLERLQSYELLHGTLKKGPRRYKTAIKVSV